jgi:DnaJ like chaperone protein
MEKLHEPMRVIGKIVGGGLGYYFAGPFGALAGLAVGHQLFDNAPRTFFGVAVSEREVKNSVFFAATFSMLGKLAQADNEVSEDEVITLKHLLKDYFKLSYSSEQFAMKMFNKAMQTDTTFEEHANAFHHQFSDDKAVLESMIEIMFRIAYADLEFHENEERMIKSAAEIFGLSGEYERLLRSFTTDDDSLELSYEMLRCQPSDDMATITQNYETELELHEPETLFEKGIPAELNQISRDRFNRIKNAYQRIIEDRQ